MRKIDLNVEKKFENLKVTSDNNPRKNQNKFYWATKIAIDKHNKITLKHIKDKVILEIGCSDAKYSSEYINESKYYYGCDISNKAIEIAKNKNLKNTNFICCDAHKLPYKKNQFDSIIVNSLLHHLDLDTILKEIKRTLKENGLLIIREPLGINPIFNLYRYITPSSRTPDEIPFGFKELKLIKKLFIIKNESFFGFTSLFSSFYKSKKLRKYLTLYDNILSYTLLKYLYWQISGVYMVKHTNE